MFAFQESDVNQNLPNVEDFFFTRTIDTFIVAYGKGKLTCFLADLNAVFDVVSLSCFSAIIKPTFNFMKMNRLINFELN